MIRIVGFSLLFAAALRARRKGQGTAAASCSLATALGPAQREDESYKLMAKLFVLDLNVRLLPNLRHYHSLITVQE